MMMGVIQGSVARRKGDGRKWRERERERGRRESAVFCGRRSRAGGRMGIWQCLWGIWKGGDDLVDLLRASCKTFFCSLGTGWNNNGCSSDSSTKTLFDQGPVCMYRT